MARGRTYDFSEAPIKVYCSKCQELVDEGKDTEFLGISEDIQGADVLEFRCKKCGTVNKSRRLG